MASWMASSSVRSGGVVYRILVVVVVLVLGRLLVIHA
jgi:hypothetical protein